MNFSVTKNGKPLNPKLYSWDPKTKTFSSNEKGLVLDFSNIDGVTFKTCSYCTFTTGNYCTFDTGYECTFKTGNNCTFNTGFKCTFKTVSDCNFKTGFSCTFDTGSHCTFDTDCNCTFKTGSYCTFTTGSYCTFDTGYDCTLDVYNNLKEFELGEKSIIILRNVKEKFKTINDKTQAVLNLRSKNFYEKTQAECLIKDIDLIIKG
jgi:hypothetical protein